MAEELPTPEQNHNLTLYTTHPSEDSKYHMLALPSANGEVFDAVAAVADAGRAARLLPGQHAALSGNKNATHVYFHPPLSEAQATLFTRRVARHIGCSTVVSVVEASYHTTEVRKINVAEQTRAGRIFGGVAHTLRARLSQSANGRAQQPKRTG